MNKLVHGLLAGLVALVILLGSTGTAHAQEPPVAGTGSITATGMGTAVIDGSGTVEIAEGAGVIWIHNADSIERTGEGRVTTYPNGSIRLTVFSGNVTVTGSDMRVRIAGGAINVTATGSGRAVLTGEGSYTTSNGGSGNWLGTVIEF